MMIAVRHERPEDAVAIRRINKLAFGQPNEARLVDTLRASARLPNETGRPSPAAHA
jgi:predicted N-acetyltransferase YhbS